MDLSNHGRSHSVCFRGINLSHIHHVKRPLCHPANSRMDLFQAGIISSQARCKLMFRDERGQSTKSRDFGEINYGLQECSADLERQTEVEDAMPKRKRSMRVFKMIPLKIFLPIKAPAFF